MEISEERRGYRRWAIRTPVYIQTARFQVSAESLDLSGSGMRIESDAVVSKGNFVEVNFLIPGRERPVLLAGWVTRQVWSDESAQTPIAFAVEFCQSDGGLTEALRRSAISGDSESIQHDFRRKGVLQTATSKRVRHSSPDARSDPQRPDSATASPGGRHYGVRVHGRNGTRLGSIRRGTWARAVLVTVAVLSSCPDGNSPRFEGILALTAANGDSDTTRLHVQWKKAYDGTPFTYQVFAAVGREPDSRDAASPDWITTTDSSVLELTLDPASLFLPAPPPDYLARDYRFVVKAIDDEGQATTSATVSIVPRIADDCGCQLSPTLSLPGGDVAPLLDSCSWTSVEGSESCHWTVRTNRPNSDPASPDPYRMFTSEVYFHPQAPSSRPTILIFHGGTAYSARGAEYVSASLASHSYAVVVPQMRDAYAGQVGTSAPFEEIERVKGIVEVFDFLKRMTTPGDALYQSQLAGLLSANFSRLGAAGGSDGGFTAATVAATPPGPLPFPNSTAVFPVVPFRSQIRGVFIVAAGSTASPHEMGLRDSAASTAAQITIPSALMVSDADITEAANHPTANLYHYTVIDDPDPSNPGIDKFFHHVHNGQDDTVPSRNAHVCYADPRNFPEAYTCDDPTELFGMPIEPTMLDHHRLLRHHSLLFFDRYLRGDVSIGRDQLTAPWYSPTHPIPDPQNPLSGFDSDGYPVPVSQEETAP